MPSETHERFSSYSLSGLLPENHALVLDHELRVLTQFQTVGQACTIVEQQQFTDQEWELLCALIETYPYYCPFAHLLAAKEGKSLSRCEQVVNRALNEGDINEVMRPTRNILSRVRLKLHCFGIDIRSMIETGYMLLPDKQQAAAKKGNW